MELKDILIKTRKELHYTQEEFATKLNITRGTLSHIERGRTPSADTAKKIEAYYNKSIAELLGQDTLKRLLNLETTNLLINNLIEKGEITSSSISERAKNSIWDTLEIEIQLKIQNNLKK